MNRRDMLTAAMAAPAVALAGAAAAKGVAPTDTPVTALFREWEQVRGEYNNWMGHDDADESLDLWKRLVDVEDAISSATSHTARDVGCKLVVAETYGDFTSDHFQALLAEARALIAA